MDDSSRFQFYIGIDPKDTQEFETIYDSINESLLPKMDIHDTYDDPYGYFTYVITGNWTAYNQFLNRDGKIIKSVNHYEE